MRRLLLFDLDETLIEEQAAAAAAFDATAAFAVSETDNGMDPASFVTAARVSARELCRTSPFYDYFVRLGISSTETLWCGFEGGDATTRALRKWTPGHRRAVWSKALQSQGIADNTFASSLAQRFASERRLHHRVFPDVMPTLSVLAETHALGLITNGPSCLQQEKIDATGLRPFFAVVVVSAELGTGKPDALIFNYALAAFDASLKDAVMLGDSLPRDIEGALTAGLDAIWVNRLEQPPAIDRPGIPEISTLAEVPAVLTA
jgi:putative hydrolase of the HAD superfamily